MKNKLLLLFILASAFSNISAQQSELSVEKIMQDPKWMGTFPSNIHWGVESENIYFDYNPDGDPADSLYRINIHSLGKIKEVSPQEKENLVPQQGDFNEKRTKKVFTEEGRLVLYDSRSEEKKQLLDLGGKIENPQFLKDESKIGFVFNNNAFVYDLKSGSIKKITNIENGRKKAEDEELTPKAEFLQQENLKLLQVVNERKEKKESSKEYREAVAPKEFTFYLNDKKLSELHISPNAEYVSFRLIETEKSKGTKIPNFVDKSGYTVDIPWPQQGGR